MDFANLLKYAQQVGAILQPILAVKEYYDTRNLASKARESSMAQLDANRAAANLEAQRLAEDARRTAEKNASTNRALMGVMGIEAGDYGRSGTSISAIRSRNVRDLNTDLSRITSRLDVQNQGFDAQAMSINTDYKTILSKAGSGLSKSLFASFENITGDKSPFGGGAKGYNIFGYKI